MKQKILLGVALLLVAVLFGGRMLSKALLNHQYAELGPWYIETVLPDGQTEHFGSWRTREKCEAEIRQTEERAHAHGSKCFFDKVAAATHWRPVDRGWLLADRGWSLTTTMPDGSTKEVVLLDRYEDCQAAIKIYVQRLGASRGECVMK